MFRKPKRGTNKASLRSHRKPDDDDDHADPDVEDQLNNDDDDDDEQDATSKLFQGHRSKTSNSKRVKREASSQNDDNVKKNVMHQFEASSASTSTTAADLATSTAQHHPEQQQSSHTAADATTTTTTGRGSDGIYREKTRNPFLAGPIKVSTNIRTTCRFDYQPDICKDYKDTGFCGFGDTCIYLHDRGDTLTGWQLEEQWQEQQKLKQQQQQADMEAFADGTFGTSTITSSSSITMGATTTNNNTGVEVATTDNEGLPFACYICREPFTDPIVTSCGHYFCERCIVDHVRSSADSNCPICHKDTHGVFNQPTKLITKKRRLVGAQASWQDFAKAMQK